MWKRDHVEKASTADLWLHGSEIVSDRMDFWGSDGWIFKGWQPLDQQTFGDLAVAIRCV
ncbi:hypothetical protein BREVUG8_110941 [Brevundimonas sp. G8]|nr:hypothetical protein BREVUG8_110941 [Brevundimonas sp. G8]